MVPFAVALTAPRSVALVDEPVADLGPADVRLQTLYSGISAGTELAAYRGTNPYLHKQWDAERRLFVPEAEDAPTPFPLTSWGYEEVGEVVEAGRESGLELGDVVFGTWGHRSQHVGPGAYARDRVLPASIDARLGIFSHIGPTALNGVLDCAVRLGETAAVFGLGVVGQLCVQLLRLSGARVVGADLLASRRELAGRLGLERVVDPADGPTASQIKHLTDGRGADVCIEASGSTVALHEAIRACAYNGRVVALGFYQGQAQGLFLGEEFHHNRIGLVCSQIGGIAPELQHRWDRLRLVRTFMDLAIRGAVACTPLITHQVPAREAPAMYRLLDERPQDVLQAVLDFRSNA
ncbi:MAG: zinc-binding alcohol dehydrogenase [Chloroflexi bacterium]|nr:zinc-binding alcohol dehydrogenase [Chloroflexota bacterium]